MRPDTHILHLIHARGSNYDWSCKSLVRRRLWRRCVQGGNRSQRRTRRSEGCHRRPARRRGEGKQRPCLDLADQFRVRPADGPHDDQSRARGRKKRRPVVRFAHRAWYARKLEAEGKLKIYEGLSKNAYYTLLNNTRVLFNCALQDWVSNTVSEADTLGANVLYPAYRSFPETFADDPNRLYVPWSIDDAYTKLELLLEEPHHNMGLISDWTDGTVDRIVDILEGKGESWNRAGNRYRDHVSQAKYPVRKIES